MRRQLSAVIVSTLVFSTPAFAQQDWVRDLLLAAQLPIVALEARNEGIPNNDIGAILDAVRRNGLPAREAALILDTVRVVRRDHGPTDNFGAFVQSQLAAGKRGTDLAAAIRAEHARMGKGRGNANPGVNDAGKGRGNAPAGRGRGDDAASAGRGNDAARGRSGSASKPPAETPSRGQSQGNRGRGGPPSR
jgi:hypothetical protein